MTTMTPLMRRPRRGLATLLIVAAAAVSVGIGSLLGNPTSTGILIASLILGLTVETLVIVRPFWGFLVLAGTPFMLAVFAVTDDRYLNAFDVLLPVLFVVGYWGGARAQSMAEDARLEHPAHRELVEVRRKFVKASIIYCALALASLIQLAIRVGIHPAFEVLMFIARSIEGALIFALAMWWLRSEKRIRATLAAALWAGGLLAVVNCYQVFVMKTARAGMTWVFNHPEWPVESANETGATLVFLCAFLVLFRFRMRFLTYVFLAVALMMLILTQSRSAQLMLLAFALLSQKKFHWRPILVGALLVGLVMALAPQDYFDRMYRTLTFKKGSFEVYSFMIRVYGYQSAVKLFLDHWLFGVGFLGCRYLSQHYNDLGLTMLGAENLYLETAAGLGLVGLGVMAYWHVRLIQLALVVGRVTRPGSLAHRFSRFHLPLLIGLSIYNLTGNGFQGIIGIGQMGLWCAMMLRAAHLDVEAALNAGESPPGATPEPKAP